MGHAWALIRLAVSLWGETEKNSTRANLFRFDPERWGNRPASLWIAEDFWVLGFQADGETRSVVTASSIRRRSAAWTILPDWTCRSRKQSLACLVPQTDSCAAVFAQY